VQSGINKILFVDDDPRVLDAFKRMVRLQAHEWQCRFAEGVDSAWELILAETPDAIVSDLNMPGKSGRELLAMVRGRQETEYTPFVLLTGNNEVKNKMECLESGATDFLNKPCEFYELAARLRNALKLKEYQDTVQMQNEALETRVRERTIELESSRREVIIRLAMATELRDSETGYHILRVGLLSKLLAEELGYNDVFQDNLLLASTLHDVGKLAIPDQILRKPGKLTDEEYREMQSHCTIGADVLRSDLDMAFAMFAGISSQSNGLIEQAATIAASHHEKWDGSGYPNGLSGESIPVVGRIVAVADVYDALCSKRPYKEAMGADEALEIIKAGSGKHFDPKVSEAFVRRHEDARRIMQSYSDERMSERKSAA
jgi:response regulator RpfG family c-di-GMP phosphodiesterase